jgi:DNA repair exonuclease SbcCD ATPase subunit
MSKRHCIVLVLTSALAIGCASAHAQDGQNPPPQPQPAGPGGPPPEGHGPQMGDPGPQRRAPEEERVREAEKRVREAATRVQQLERDGFGPNHPAMVEAKTQVERAQADLERVRADVAEMKARRMDDHIRLPMGPGGPDDRRPDGMGPQGRPSVEQRLAMLERAVREMHEMFERHNVPPEMRERAEREMRERRDGGLPPRDGRPGEGAGAGPRPDGPGAGGPPPMAQDLTPRPPMRRMAGGPGQPNMDEVKKQMDAARDMIEALKKQLADTQEALKKAQAEIEELRANAKK